VSDVFISYSRKDGDFVHKLDNALTTLKREVWVDWQDIARGEDWWRSIQTGVDSADTALIVVTEHWLVSEICQRELNYIRQQNKRVFPIIRQKIEGDVALRVKGTWVDQEWEQQARDNWKFLRSVNWIYFDDDTTFDSVLQDLITALDTDQLYIKSHTRYLVRAMEWQQFHRNPSFLLEGDQLQSAKEWLDSSANKHPEPHPAHHEYITAGKVAETARQARDKAREGLIRRFRQMAVILGVLVVVTIIVAAVVGQQFIVARAEVTKAGATLQQVNIQVTGAIQQQSTAIAQVQVAQNLVATATIEQGNAVAAQRTSFARENIAGTKVAVAGATLSPVPPTLTAVASAISSAYDQQEIALEIANASIALADKNLPEAADIVNGLVADYPDEALAYIGSGLIQETAGQMDEAVVSYTRAIELDPNNTVAYSNRANVYQQLGKHTEAIADYTKSIEVDPENADAYLNRGLAHYDLQEYDQAIPDFEAALQIDPNYVEAYNNIGLVYIRLKKYDDALTQYNKAIEIDPRFAAAYGNRGNVYQMLGQPDLALADFNKSIQLAPNVAEVYDYRGRIYYSQNQYDLALADYNHAVSLDSTFSTAYNDRGLVYFYQDKLDEALADYNQALELDPESSEAYNNRGVLYLGQGKLDDALDDFTQAIDIDPNYVNAIFNTGNVYLKQGKFDDALNSFTHVIELDPQNIRAYYQRGIVNFQQGDMGAAIDNMSQVIQIDNSFALAYLARGLAYAQLGKLPEAAADYWQWTQLNQTTSDKADLVAMGKTSFSTTINITQGSVYSIPFEAKAGQLLQASASGVDGTVIDTLLIVLDPQGKAIFYNDDLSSSDISATIQDYVLPADGQYTLIVSHTSTTEGKVLVTLNLTSTSAVTPTLAPTATR